MVPGVVKVLDAASGKEKLSLAGHRDQVYGLTFSPDGRRLASAGYVRNESEVKLWDVAGGRDLLTLPAIGYGNLMFHPDGFRLSYVSSDHGLRRCRGQGAGLGRHPAARRAVRSPRPPLNQAEGRRRSPIAFR